MNRRVDVAVIGAGHAGLNAIKEIRKVTENYVLINGGQLGTTCARIGCLPSKVALHLAETHNNSAHGSNLGIEGGEGIQVDTAQTMERIRDLRDQETLPESIAVLGLGPMGIELAQALHGLGVRVVGVDQGDTIARIDDPIVNKMAIEIMARDFPLWLGAGVCIERQGDGFRVRSGERELGAAMVGAECEHLAHLVAWAVETGMTVTEALRMPYYHPVYEEAIQDALSDLDRHLNGTGSSMVQFQRLDPVAPARA